VLANQAKTSIGGFGKPSPSANRVGKRRTKVSTS